MTQPRSSIFGMGVKLIVYLPGDHNWDTKIAMPVVLVDKTHVHEMICITKSLCAIRMLP